MKSAYTAPLCFLACACAIGAITYVDSLVPGVGKAFAPYQRDMLTLCWSGTAVYIGFILGMVYMQRYERRRSRLAASRK